MASRFRNEKYYRKLSKKERRQFKTNCNNDPKDSFKDIMNYEFFSIKQFIGGAFLWDQTPEGHDYWAILQNKYKSKK
jgi:hypothetical protein